MFTRNVLTACLAVIALCGIAPGVRAGAPFVSQEYAVEASTDGTLLPASNAGTVIRTCENCTTTAYQLTADTTYFIGTQQVTLAQLNAYVATSGSHALTLFVKPGGTTVTRIVIPQT